MKSLDKLVLPIRADKTNKLPVNSSSVHQNYIKMILFSFPDHNELTYQNILKIKWSVTEQSKLWIMEKDWLYHRYSAWSTDPGCLWMLKVLNDQKLITLIQGGSSELIENCGYKL